MKKGLISIVTVCFNADVLLEQTINSVLFQDHQNFEYIIIDGNSKDKTIEILKRYELIFLERNISFRWISESDNGIFDAMNKGILMSRGNWINFMNAGDSFVDKSVLSKIKFDIYNDVAIIYGNTINDCKLLRFPLEIDCVQTGGMFACHQSMFFNKSLLKETLWYPQKYKYFGDIELTMRIYKKAYRLQYVDIAIANYLGGGVSSTVHWEARKAKYFYLLKYFGLKSVIKGLLKRGGVIRKDVPIKKSISLAE